ncbi:unnamed protein product [Allacma fusca]|uniref:Gustatory receptor n=1 Tax=Allacma fusca TaxID=39272 RepID=A0A8J2LPT8_9HEXA|nr:unnamed protein product [Allacma fusca]
MVTLKTAPVNQEHNQTKPGKASFELWPYFLLLRLSATHPISQRNFPPKNNGSSRNLFYFKWTSLISIISAAASLFSFYVLALMILNGLFEIYWPQKLFDFHGHLFEPTHTNSSTKEIRNVFALTNFFTPAVRLVVIVHQMFSIRAAVKHLNAFARLANDLEVYCTQECRNFRSEIRKNSIKILIVVVGIPLVATLGTILLYRLKGAVVAPMVMREFVQFIVPLQVICTYVDDADFIMQCIIVCEFYHQLETAILSNQHKLRVTGGTVRLVQVRKWHEFVQANRSIIHQIGTITKVPQLLSFLEVIVNLTIFLYSVLNILASSNLGYIDTSFLSAAAGYVAANLVRLYIKTVQAENEVRVHEALFAINHFCQNLEVQIELQAMRSTIVTTPASIALGNYVVIHKGVFLTAALKNSKSNMISVKTKEWDRVADNDDGNSSLWPFLWFCRFTGTLPINCMESKNGIKRRYYFAGTSIISAYSVFLSAISVYSFGMVILNGAFEIYWPQTLFVRHYNLLQPTKPSATGLIIKLLSACNFILPFCRVVTIVVRIMNFPKITENLNSIEEFIEEFRAHWGSKGYAVDFKIRKNSLRLLALFLAVSLIVIAPNAIYGIDGGSLEAPLVERELILGAMLLQRLLIFVEDAEFHIQCNVVSEFYYQMAKTVQHAKDHLTLKDTITSEDAQAWERFFTRNRRLISKIGSASKEDCFHEALLSLNKLPQSLEAKIELKSMGMTMTTSPACISLGSYAVLNQGIILTISTQVMTYLIVLLQFGKPEPPKG